MHSTQGTRVQHELSDVASSIHQVRPLQLLPFFLSLVMRSERVISYTSSASTASQGLMDSARHVSEEEERLYHKGQQSNRKQHDQPISHKLTS